MGKGFPIKDTRFGGEVRHFTSGDASTKVTLVPRDEPKIVEISTSGFDENLQTVFGDPFGGTSWVGLRVPALPTPDKDSRYLFMLASFSIGERAKARILGYRQMVTLGVQQGPGGPGTGSAYIEEFLVQTPFWRPQDGNVSFHLHRLGPPRAGGIPVTGQGPTDLRSFKFQWCENPALLYQTAAVPNPIYTNLTAYTPPNKGRPWGTPLRNGLKGNLYGLQTQWETHGAWTSLDIPLEGPDTIALFASVRQTNASARPTLAVPMTFYPGGVPPEELFLLNFPTAAYWRVAGSLVVAMG